MMNDPAVQFLVDITSVVSTPATLMAGDRSWIIPAIIIGLAGIGLAVFVSRNRLGALSVATGCRILGWLLIAACLVNPLWSSARPRKGANVLAVVTDISRSHLVAAGSETRADLLTETLRAGELSDPGGWLHRIDQDFELRRYVLADRLERVSSFENVAFDGPASNLSTSLTELQQRFQGQPLAGIILLSDGNSTDGTIDLDALQDLPPVYPVFLPEETDQADVAVDTVTINQTAFDDAPVTLQVQIQQTNAAAGRTEVTLLNDQGVPLETQTHSNSDTSPVRFEVRPEKGGTVFYKIQTKLLDADGEAVTEEATLINNERLVAVDRGSRKRRVLYVSGRPNWEFKFLNRAVETDPQTELVGLIRIAKREAKFDFRGNRGESSNSLFKGFDETEQELAEEYDEPVMRRAGQFRDDELTGGFPEDAEELFAYDAIILDDIEARFFLADQLKLIYDFVSRRGGGLLMMGGQESFRQGEYDRTPVGELLPIDLHRETAAPGGPVRLNLTREGWLQPWVRVRSEEAAEQQRINQMPAFVTINPADTIRPGAIIMATVKDSGGTDFPALVTQRFGRGRTAALCIGDFWRWRMNEGRRRLQDFALGARNPSNRPLAPGEKPEEDLNDHARACRQMVRWLVAEVPQRLDVKVQPAPELGVGTVRIQADLKSPEFEVQDDADVRFVVTGPDGTDTKVAAEPSDEVIGRFEAVVPSPVAGPYTAAVTASLPQTDGPPEVLQAQIGWASQPDREEMAAVQINRSLLQSLAATTGGRILQPDELDQFSNESAHQHAPLVEVWSWPVWHQWWVFVTAVACFVTDWTLRRRQGLP